MKNGLYAYAYYHYMRNNGTSEIFRAFIAGPREYADSHKKIPRRCESDEIHRCSGDSAGRPDEQAPYREKNCRSQCWNAIGVGPVSASSASKEIEAVSMWSEVNAAV